MIKEAKRLGMALGIPCLDGLEEAEAQCASLDLESLCVSMMILVLITSIVPAPFFIYLFIYFFSSFRMAVSLQTRMLFFLALGLFIEMFS
jgi:hypothetical protein